MKPRITFVGTGIMGEPMAGNLIEAGYPISRERRHESSIRRRDFSLRIWKGLGVQGYGTVSQKTTRQDVALQAREQGIRIRPLP